MFKPVNASHCPFRFGSPKHCGIGDMLKETVSLTVVATEMRKKRTMSVIKAIVAKNIKYLAETINLVIQTPNDKLELIR